MNNFLEFHIMYTHYFMLTIRMRDFLQNEYSLIFFSSNFGKREN